MIFYLLHSINYNIIKGNISNQTRNLLTFLIGVVLYTILWTFLYRNREHSNLIIDSLKYGFIYIFIADCFSIAIIYKNYYKRNITTEISDFNVSSEIPVQITPEYKNVIDETVIEKKEKKTKKKKDD